MKVARRSIVPRKGEGMRDPGPPLPHPQRKINVEFTGASVCDFIAFFTRLGPDFSRFWSRRFDS